MTTVAILARSYTVVLFGIHYLQMPYSYKLQCPEAMLWNIYDQRLCNRTHRYSCIFDENEERFGSKCQIPIVQRPGSMVTYLGGIFIRECTEERFQPVKFLTNETSNCIFAKSFCSEEGSVLVDNGTTRTDVKCRCDYTKDYSYVNEPRDKCGCQPTVDDCSCYLKTCPGSHVLSQDYTCVDMQNWTGSFFCPEISPQNNSMLPPSPSQVDVEDDDEENIPVPSYSRYGVTLVLICLMLLVGVLLLIKIYKSCYERIKKNDDKRVRGLELLEICPIEKSDKDSSEDENRDDTLQQDYKAVKEAEDCSNDLTTTKDTCETKEFHDIVVHATPVNVSLCRSLLKLNAGIDLCDKKGRSALIHACNILQEDLAILLIKEGADVNKSDSLGNTPLTIASQNNLVSVVNTLLDKNVDVNAVNENGATALSLACMNGYTEIFKMLLEHKAKPDIPDKDGWTPLMHAVHCSEK